MYLVIQVFLIAFAYFCLIETKGYTIEEVARLFDGKDATEELAAVAAGHSTGEGKLDDEKERDEHLEQDPATK